MGGGECRVGDNFSSRSAANACVDERTKAGEDVHAESTDLFCLFGVWCTYQIVLRGGNRSPSPALLASSDLCYKWTHDGYVVEKEYGPCNSQYRFK